MKLKVYIIILYILNDSTLLSWAIFLYSDNGSVTINVNKQMINCLFPSTVDPTLAERKEYDVKGTYTCTQFQVKIYNVYKV
jgi:hypothetical protein